jgi:ankyrin repeat protein
VESSRENSGLFVSQDFLTKRKRKGAKERNVNFEYWAFHNIVNKSGVCTPLSAVQQGFNGKRSKLGIKDSEGRTAMYFAADRKNHTILEILGHEFADEIAEDNGFMALRWAVKDGNTAIVHTYMQKIIDKQVYTATDRKGQTLLHWAANGGNVEICNLLISEGADITATDGMGQTTTSCS